MTKTAKVIAMKTMDCSSIKGSGFVLSTATNCGRKAKKKIESFGFRTLTRIAETMT
jgi:hypothetical protein